MKPTIMPIFFFFEAFLEEERFVVRYIVERIFVMQTDQLLIWFVEKHLTKRTLDIVHLINLPRGGFSIPEVILFLDVSLDTLPECFSFFRFHFIFRVFYQLIQWLQNFNVNVTDHRHEHDEKEQEGEDRQDDFSLRIHSI